MTFAPDDPSGVRAAAQQRAGVDSRRPLLATDAALGRARGEALAARLARLHAGARRARRHAAREHGARGTLRPSRRGSRDRAHAAARAAPRLRVRRGDRVDRRPRVSAHLAVGARPSVRRAHARRRGLVRVRRGRVGTHDRRHAALPDRRHERRSCDRPERLPRRAAHPRDGGGEVGAHAQRARMGARRAVGERLRDHVRGAHRSRDGARHRMGRSGDSCSPRRSSIG